jgi:5-hydroxyisourate hydrolase
MGDLSTQVLDTARGLPAAGVVVEVRIVRGSESQRIAAATTNAQGRTDAPLVAGDRLERGIYELTFHVGDYFRAAGVALSDPPFLDHVVIRVGIADAAATYHVPLLISPYGYTTYRGT